MNWHLTIYLENENTFGPRVIDAATRSFSKSELVGHVLTREQVIGQPFAQTVFAICDTIFLEDERIAELHSAPIVH